MRPRGFVQIEIAMVLLIIGLSLGGILKGAEWVDNLKVKSLVADFRHIPLFIHGYQDKFRALPGDDDKVVIHLAGAIRAATSTRFGVACANGNCAGNGSLDGAWNSTSQADETYLFWQHVRLAGLAPGSRSVAEPDYLPVNAVGGRIGIQGRTGNVAYAPLVDANGVAIRGEHIICSTDIPGSYLLQMDIELDDGNTDSGSMLATSSIGYSMGGTGPAAVATSSIDVATRYTVCMGV
jgi:hypothetical protein